MTATHNEVAHNWAHQTGRAQNGHHMLYRDRTIYSYGRHFPIATLVDTAHGTVVLMTIERYSVSTAKHITITRRACGHLPTFEVPYTNHVGPTGMELWGHARNLDSYAKRITDALQRAKRARKWAGVYLGDAARLIREHNQYIAAFGLTAAPAVMPADIEEAVLAATAAQREAEARREALRRETYKATIDAWLGGAKVACPHTATALVRVNGDRVETSWGASVPLADARVLFELAQRAVATGKTIRPSTPVHVGTYTLDHVSADGTLRVGCHLITYADQQRAAQLAGIA